MLLVAVGNEGRPFSPQSREYFSAIIIRRFAVNCQNFQNQMVMWYLLNRRWFLTDLYIEFHIYTDIGRWRFDF
jgi:hypothetical protein